MAAHNLHALQLSDSDAVQVTTGAATETALPLGADGKPARTVTVVVEGVAGDTVSFRFNATGGPAVTDVSGFYMQGGHPARVFMTGGATVISHKAITGTPGLRIVALENQ